ncbi:MAG: hypothetical protein AAB605_01235 [Patescibacteria group bacterium]
MFSIKRGVGKPVLIVDIGDGSVGVSLVTLGHTPVQVHASTRATLPFEDRTHEQILAAITNLFKDTAEKFLKTYREKGGTAPSAAHVVLRAPWTRFRTARADGAFEKEQTITKDVIARFAKQALAQPSELDRSSILEAGVMQVFLNGYPTGNPLGKHASSISVVAFESDIDPAMKRAITDEVAALLPDRPLSLHSGLRALLIVMQEYLPELQRFFLIDLGSATTACAVVRRDAITQYAAASEGLATILKRVASGGLPEETMSLLRMLATDTCSSSACEALKDSLARAEPDLVRAFGEVFTSLAGVRRLPNATILVAPLELSQWLHGFFSRIDFSQFTTTTQPFIVETLTPEHLRDSVSWGKEGVPDTGIATAAFSVQLMQST